MSALLILTCKVFPKSRKQLFTRDANNQLKCYIKSPPEDGKANRELVALIAEKVGIRQADISIVRGLTSRTKTISLDTTLTITSVLEKLGVTPLNQTSILDTKI